MNTRLVAMTAVLTVFLGSFALIVPVHATTTCTFTTVGTTMTLDGDCTTDATILIPDGFTLDGAGHTITAVDPVGGHFLGAVVANAGTTAYVKNLVIKTSSLANVCDYGGTPDNRLRGILFNGASGSITNSYVMNINQGASGCQEGNAIEIRNAPFDGTGENPVIVEIANNEITDYQKSGIVANGNVDVWIHNNQIGASATQANLAANSVQFGFGADGSLKHNTICGNQWYGASDYVATAVLVTVAGFVEIVQNNIRGNADVGIYVDAEKAVVNNNKVFDDPSIPDSNQHGYDFGIGNWGGENSITNNKVGGYEYPYDGVTGGGNKVVPNGPID